MFNQTVFAKIDEFRRNSEGVRGVRGWVISDLKKSLHMFCIQNCIFGHTVWSQVIHILVIYGHIWSYLIQKKSEVLVVIFFFNFGKYGPP